MNVMKTSVLLAAMTALFMAVGFLLAGEVGMILAFVAAAGMNAYAFWNSDKAVLKMHGARLVTQRDMPWMYDMMVELSRNANMPLPKIYYIATSQPNAFATGRSPEKAAVAITQGLIDICDRQEIAGVMAHELAHIQNRDTLIMTVTATIAGAIGFLSQFAMFFGGRGDSRPNPIIQIAIMVLAPLAASIVQMAISRTREYSADKLGAEICGHPEWLASALRKIEMIGKGHVNQNAESNPATAHMFIINPLRMGGIDGLFRTHPKTELRIRELMALRERGFQSLAKGGSSFASPTSGQTSSNTSGRDRNRPWR